MTRLGQIQAELTALEKRRSELLLEKQTLTRKTGILPVTADGHLACSSATLSPPEKNLPLPLALRLPPRCLSQAVGKPS
jgi:hypothetical protein